MWPIAGDRVAPAHLSPDALLHLRLLGLLLGLLLGPLLSILLFFKSGPRRPPRFNASTLIAISFIFNRNFYLFGTMDTLKNDGFRNA